MGFNTFPCNPYPISTEELNKVNNDDLNTRVAALESDVSDLNSNKANQITIAPFFNSEASYSVGDLVYYNGLTYRCTNDHEGAWDADDFAATTISNELDTLKSGLTGVMTTKLTACNMFVPSTKTDITEFLGYILGTIIEEQEAGIPYSVYGAWENHDYFIGTVYKITSDTAMAYINYGSGSNMVMYNVTYKADTYIHYKQIQYTT